MRSRLGLWLTRKLDTHTPAKKISPHQRCIMCEMCSKSGCKCNCKEGDIVEGVWFDPQYVSFYCKKCKCEVG